MDTWDIITLAGMPLIPLFLYALLTRNELRGTVAMMVFLAAGALWLVSLGAFGAYWLSQHICY